MITQQVTMAPLEVSLLGLRVPINKDSWDGYRWERSKLLNFIKDNINNVVVLTGDIHTTWANDLPADHDNYNESTGAGSACVEFITPALTSKAFDYFATYGLAAPVVKLSNPWVKYVDIEKKGYIVIDITKTRTQSDIYFINKIDDRNYTESFIDSWYVNLNERTLNHAGGRSSNMSAYPVKPSEYPNQTLGIKQTEPIPGKIVLLGVYPNPFSDAFAVQYYLYESQSLDIYLKDLNGKVVLTEHLGEMGEGLHYYSAGNLKISAGTYLLILQSKSGNTRQIKIIKY